MLNQVNLLSERLQSSKSVTVLTGAGISAESGIPTFRGEEVLSKRYRSEGRLIATKVPNAAQHALCVLGGRTVPNITFVVEINTEPSLSDLPGMILAGKAAELVPKII